MRKLLILIPAALLVTFYTSCNSTTSGGGGSDGDSDVSYLIENGVTGVARSSIADFIRALPYDLQGGGVVLIDGNTKTVYGSLVKLNNNGIVDFLPGNPVDEASNPKNRLKNQGALQTDCSSTTGPFHRITSRPGAYNQMSAVLGLPKVTDVNDFEKTQPSGDVAYMYVGGWGSGFPGKPVDVGLKHNSERNTWEPFVSIRDLKPGFFAFDNTDYVDPGNRTLFKPGTPVALKFGVGRSSKTGKDYIYLNVSGTNTSDVSARITLGMSVQAHIGLSGWKYDAQDIVFKRLTMIGQTDTYVASFGDFTVLPDGSFSKRRAYAVTNAYIYDAKWSSVKLGRAGSLQDWSDSDSTDCNVPYNSDPAKGPWISVNKTDAANESISIVLRRPANPFSIK
jgi:hypothetical protein